MTNDVRSNLRTNYSWICKNVLEQGRVVRPRGYETREILGHTIYMDDLQNAMPIGCGRDLKPAIGAAEALLLCGGIASPSLLISVSKAFQRFLDGGQLHGAYGPRVRPQLPRVVERLQADPDSRQAFVSIWNGAYDGDDTRDLPCTVSFNFHIRDGRLVMHSHMRSQDVFLGLAYDCWFFGQLAMTVARALRLEPEETRLIHHVDSFHAYARDFEAIERLHEFDPDAVTEQESVLALGDDNPSGFGFDGEGTISDYMQRARDLYNGGGPTFLTESEIWYIDVLRQYDRLTASSNFAS